MKKIISVLAMFLLLGNFNLDRAYAIEGTSDAKCENVDQSGYKEVGLDAPDEQTFIPSYDRLTKIDIIVGGHMWGMDGINFTLYNSVGTVVGSGSIAPTINGGPTVRTWTPASPISVRKGVTYRFRVENPNTADFVWYATGNNDCYPSGNARQKNANQNFDFGFTTFGYDASTPTPTATPAAVQTSTTNIQTDSSTSENQSTTSSDTEASNTSLNPESQAGTGESLSNSVSSSIKEPTNLVIEQTSVSNKPILKLNWKASVTSDISGYKIYRSEQEKTGYKNTSKLEKTATEFKDAEVEVGKTYYYQVRAYKSEQESKSSNTVSKAVVAVAASITAVESIIPVLAAEPLVEPKKPWWPWLTLIILLIAAALFYLYKIKKWPFDKLEKLS